MDPGAKMKVWQLLLVLLKMYPVHLERWIESRPESANVENKNDSANFFVVDSFN